MRWVPEESDEIPGRPLYISAPQHKYGAAELRPNPGQGTPQERAACSHDWRRFCRHTHGDMEAGSCLQAHRNRLHAACRGVLSGRTVCEAA